MLRLAPRQPAGEASMRPGVSFTPEGKRRARVALLHGCAQPVLDPGINLPPVRLLSRFGVEVVLAEGRRLLRRHRPSHGPRAAGAARSRAPTSTPGRARSTARGSTRSSSPRPAAARPSRITATCSALDPAYARKAARVSALALDITNISHGSTLPPVERGQRPDRRLPFRLLHAARPAYRPRCRSRFWRTPASRSATSPKATSAAARPAPTTSCSPRSPSGFATARCATSSRSRLT